MAPVRTSLPIVALTVATLALSACAAPGDQRDTHHPAQISAAQAPPGGPGMGMGMRMGTPAAAYGEQMKAMQDMQDMHEKILAAKTPAEHSALMAAQITLMHKGMNMMGGMGPMGGGAATGQPGDMAARQGMLERRMEMMQSMMQMMMDRIPTVPATK